MKTKGQASGYGDLDLFSACPKIWIFLPWPKRRRGIKHKATGVRFFKVPKLRLQKREKIKLGHTYLFKLTWNKVQNKLFFVDILNYVSAISTWYFSEEIISKVQNMKNTFLLIFRKELVFPKEERLVMYVKSLCCNYDFSFIFLTLD